MRLLGRVRADRVMHAPAGPRRGTHPGRRPRHGAEFRLAAPATHTVPAQESAGVHDRFGQVTARCRGHLHPKLEHRTSWADHPGELPIVEGTLVRLAVEHLPGNRELEPLWLWHSDPDATTHDVDRLWRIFLRRFDIEHTFRFWKQALGLTCPHLRTPQQADRWAWLVLAAYTQLRLARALAQDLRRPWERPLTPDQLTPGRVRRGFPPSGNRSAPPPARRKHHTPAPAAPRAAPPHPHPATQSGKSNAKRTCLGAAEPSSSLKNEA